MKGRSTTPSEPVTIPKVGRGGSVAPSPNFWKRLSTVNIVGVLTKCLPYRCNFDERKSLSSDFRTITHIFVRISSYRIKISRGLTQSLTKFLIFSTEKCTDGSKISVLMPEYDTLPRTRELKPAAPG